MDLGHAGPCLEEDGLAMLRGLVQSSLSNYGLVTVENITELLQANE